MNRRMWDVPRDICELMGTLARSSDGGQSTPKIGVVIGYAPYGSKKDVEDRDNFYQRKRWILRIFDKDVSGWRDIYCVNIEPLDTWDPGVGEMVWLLIGNGTSAMLGRYQSSIGGTFLVKCPLGIIGVTKIAKKYDDDRLDMTEMEIIATRDDGDIVPYDGWIGDDFLQ